MGKTLLIGVILLTVIFAAITITVQRRTAKVPEMLSQNLAEQRAANLGAYALLYGMNQIDKGAIPRSKIPFGGGFYTKNYTDFYALKGNINSLRYAALDATKDTIKIIANVTCIVGADTVHHQSEAAADFSGEAIEGLVGYWKMDEDSWDGTVDEVIDISGYDNHGIGEPTNGTYNGPTTIAAGKYDRAGEFDGIDDYVDCGNDPSLDITDAITVEAWLKPLPNPFELLDDFEDRGNETWEEIFEGGSEVWNETFEYRGDDTFEDDFEDGDIDGWTTGGHDKWFATKGKHHGGTWSARSGNIGSSQYTDIYKDITGPATLTFWWKVSSRSGSYADYLKFYVDGKQIWAICGEIGWQKKVCSVEEGTHTIKWRYQKDAHYTSGSDCGWIDDISITNIGLGEGWSTNGHRNWYVTDIYTPHGGNWSAKSGDIGSSQYTDIQRKIEGPATITFWWKVSSRSGSYADYLKFYVDGKQIWAICGDPGWQRKMYSVEQGTHTIKWRYQKDAHYTSGDDSGWIDDISITDKGLEGWDTSGHRNWYVSNLYPAHSGTWCAKSGDIGSSQYTDIQRTIEGPATITFWWKVSSRSGSYADYLKFYVDGKQIWKICGNKDWDKKVYSVQEGTHIIKWRYQKDAHYTSGYDSGWIDDISITGRGLSAGLIKVDAYGIGANTTGKGGMTAGWTTGGHRNWYLTNLYPAHSGTWCAKSGDIGRSQYTDLQRTVTGPATITFWWKVSSRSGSYADYLKFYVDGKQIWKICGNKDWDKKVYSVQEGTHIIKWRYQKDAHYTSGYDSGWIDDISITDIGLGKGWSTHGHRNWYTTELYPAHSKPWCAKSGDIGSSQYTDLYRTVKGPATITFWWKVSSRSGSYADYLKFYVDGKQIWAICGNKDWHKKVYSVQEGTHTIKWRYQKDAHYTSGYDSGWIDDISITDEGLGKEWTTSGHRNWYVTDRYKPHGGSWCTKSGDIGSSQYTDLQRTVKGPTTINFWWKVSSRSGSYADYLKFYVDGKQIWKICGNKKWQKKSYSIPGGEHNIKWRYQKDAHYTSHDDSGWIDDITGGFSDNFEDRGTEVWSEVFTERGSGIFTDDFEEGGVPPDTLSAFAMINGETISVNISSGGWTHIALTYDKDAGANNQKLYINGTRVDSTTLTEPININANNLLFGKFYMGAVDEVAIFDRALSVDEIMKIYHFGLAHKIIYWIE
ncbi:MAG: LamG domain-containing protein [Candidatus Cloacimonetes bacterium]|nr:LamG domain-containing protein [Candidatus Cloacimonadota bacterium]